MNKKNPFQREITPTLSHLAQNFPIVSVTGPRQSGKTTLVQQSFPEKPYFNLEDPSQRSQLEDDPKSLLNRLEKSGAVFDEVQHYPLLLSYLQAIVDKQQIKGQFIITGSYNLALMEAVTQSLAGRVGLLELLPMSSHELQLANFKLSTEEYLYNGGLPRIYDQNINPTLVYQNYVKTYLERDMRTLIKVKDLIQFRRFLQLCASRIGSEFIASNLANELGVSYHTIQGWLSILEASYVVFRLQPYYENFGKRIIKSPKLYFYDVGLACYLLGIESITHVIRDPLKGNLFENLVVLDFHKHLLNLGREPKLYFYRDRSQYEIDLLWQHGRQLIPIEIKISQTYRKEFIKNLNYFKKIAKDRMRSGFIVYAGTNDNTTTYKLFNYQDSHKVIAQGLEDK